ncbi:MAG: hypothetical protein A3D74_03750 [Candidatus Levybacteria bacterium RIFCSPHIGHO2_02_FULL_37_13]|nr:MAG: hypothetical protein A3D74_03750 [Candidatus Levybacteria bacterium RIFCSPHIGHO2_02_FULL_37_13]OGH29010.1 MAG: hypothetical protein A3E40_00470 [Candidatus Levybacteria bacterium RIFCSPHIGHO2_12_FULL_37_9]OGH38038.1 MAG: hypothetical protein A3B41_04925 [Candidatus Levybacteria bacterium RIFCSPLOWO2_01_FULL_37_26]
MNIFNSLGSNYNLKFALKALFAQNKKLYKEELIDFLEKKYQGKAILAYKGREAIGLAIEILKLPKDSFVAINGFTCYAVYKAINNEGYETELLDLPRSSDLNFSAETLEQSLKRNPKIKVVIIQNTLGYPCDIEKIAKICKENNLILIEDLAHSVRTVYENGKEAGTIGDFVVLSFSQDKIIDAISGGALIIRKNKYQNHLASQGKTLQGRQQTIDRLYPLFTFKIRKSYPFGIGKFIHLLLKSFNLLSKPMNESFYTKYDLPNWYCSLVLHAFDNLEENLNHRKKIVGIYNNMLEPKISYPSTLRYCIFVENRKSLIKSLKDKGVYVSDVWYDSVDDNIKNAKVAANTILNLPTHKNVSEDDAIKIAEQINIWLKSQ